MESLNLQKNQLSFSRGYGILKESGECLYSTGQITPTGDLAFKKVLASEDNKDILQGLIKDFFGITPEDIILKNPYSIEAYKENIRGKETNVFRQTLPDVSASIVCADIMVEMQIRKTAFFDRRVLYYPFEGYCENYNVQGQMQIGSDGKPNRYSSLKPIYTLNILGYTHFRDNHALRILKLYDDEINVGMDNDLISIAFFELTKEKVRTVNQMHWRGYFTAGNVASDAPEYIKKAADIIEYSNLSKEERTMITEAEKAEATYDAQLDYSYYEGIAQGIADVARNLLKDGFPPEVVAKGTGLSLNTVLDLKNR